MCFITITDLFNLRKLVFQLQTNLNSHVWWSFNFRECQEEVIWVAGNQLTNAHREGILEDKTPAQKKWMKLRADCLFFTF